MAHPFGLVSYHIYEPIFYETIERLTDIGDTMCPQLPASPILNGGIALASGKWYASLYSNECAAGALYQINGHLQEWAHMILMPINCFGTCSASYPKFKHRFQIFYIACGHTPLN